ncbi:YwdI family protein [Oceanobacillus timonensis]|uniref:YwdI family protein n=1 Tax=Oceanobacillus timonensis TaxID=1926285 RepID=UPI0009BA0142|nr:YwdI family protein [Oceanobacillus timonensis]
MAVSNEIIINKMIGELEEAKTKAHQQDQVKKHMENIHLLSELFISGSTDSNMTDQRMEQVQVNMEETEEHISEAEMKAMLGKQSTGKTVPSEKKLHEGDANGDSLFDF